MATFIVNGGRSLKGEITPQGAKNEALQVICATLLTSGKITLKNIPDIIDVRKLIELIGSMGVKITHESDSVISFEATSVDLDYLQTQEFRSQSSSLRGSIMIVGPLLQGSVRLLSPNPEVTKSDGAVLIHISRDFKNWEPDLNSTHPIHSLKLKHLH
jgi:UDP-N-acetylglucosamine 1-carboxyvinyltransferase